MNGNFIQRHAETLALQHKVSLIHVYRNQNQQEKFKIQEQQNGNLKTYLGSYKTSKLKYFASASLVRKMINKAKKEQGHIDLFFLNVFYPLGAHLFWIKWWYKKPIFALEHWTGYHATLNNGFPRFNPNHIHIKVAKIAAQYCQKVLAVSEDLSNAMQALSIPNAKGIVYNVVDAELFKPIAQKNEKFTFIHISHLRDEHKNFTMLLKAFMAVAESNEVQMLVINSGDKTPFLSLIQELQIEDSIQFLPAMPIEKVAKEMQRCHAFVLASNYENMPCVIAEALCCGLPVLSTNVGGIGEVINESNGILTPAKDLIAFANGMERIYKNYNSYEQAHIAADAIAKFGKQAVLNQLNKALGL